MPGLACQSGPLPFWECTPAGGTSKSYGKMTAAERRESLPPTRPLSASSGFHSISRGSDSGRGATGRRSGIGHHSAGGDDALLKDADCLLEKILDLHECVPGGSVMSGLGGRDGETRTSIGDPRMLFLPGGLPKLLGGVRCLVAVRNCAVCVHRLRSLCHLRTCA